LKLITVGFGGYRVDLIHSRLVKCELKYDVDLFIVTEITRHTKYV